MLRENTSLQVIELETGGFPYFLYVMSKRI